MILNSNKIFQYLPLTHTRATFRLVTKLHKHKVTSILDLEDSAQNPFSLNETEIIKSDARKNLISYIKSERFNNSDFQATPYIRINSISSKFFEEDIRLINTLADDNFYFEGIFFPKTESAEDIDKLISNISYELKVVPMIETVKGNDFKNEIVSHPSIKAFHYGHFDFALDQKQWPFLDPNHLEYWYLIDEFIEISNEHKKDFIHTPFPFTNDPALFWQMINFMKKRYSSNSIVFCTLNAELSLSEQTDENKIEFIEYPRDEANLRKLAVEIIKDFEANRANKRSFGVSNNRFIPPHQYFAAQNYLKHI